jgi:hypothetical protein
MSPNEEICGDPLFQLNLILWLSLPSASRKPLRPFFHEIGYSTYSIDPLLSLLPEQRRLAREKNINYKDSVRPDAILQRDNPKQAYILVECKKSSFGTSSTTAEQARTLMMLTDLSFNEVMGIDPSINTESSIMFFLPQDQTKALMHTVEEMQNELNINNINYGETHFAGIFGNDKGIFLELTEKLSKALSTNEVSPIMILETDGRDDPRPLYFIPYDPSIDQTPDQRIFCLQILLQRLLASLLSKIGRAIPPVRKIIAIDEMLNDATFGMYSLWRNRDTTHNLRSILRGFMVEVKGALSVSIEKKLYFSSGEGWIVEISNENEKDELINTISRIKIRGTQIVRQDQASFNDFVDKI